MRSLNSKHPFPFHDTHFMMSFLQFQRTPMFMAYHLHHSFASHFVRIVPSHFRVLLLRAIEFPIELSSMSLRLLISFPFHALTLAISLHALYLICRISVQLHAHTSHLPLSAHGILLIVGRSMSLRPWSFPLYAL